MSNNINNDNWIEAVKQKATSSKRQVPEGAWEAIAQSLQQQNVATTSPKRARIAPRMWKAVAAAAAVAIVAATGFFLLNDEAPSTVQQLAQNTPAAPAVQQPATTATSPAEQETTAESTTSTPLLAKSTTSTSNNTGTIHHHHRSASTNGTATHHRHHRASQDFAQPQDYEQEPLMDGEEQLAYEENEFNPDEYFYDIETMQALEELYAEYDNAMNQEAMEPWRSYSDSTYHQHLAYDANARRIAREQMALPRSKPKPELLMAAYGNGLISGDRNSTSTAASPQNMAAPGIMLAPAPSGMAQNVTMPVNYSYHHHMPLTVGLTFTKRIVGNLYGNLGLNFTSMNSDVTPDNGTESFKQNVKLIGLPFGVRWNFWRYKGLTTFVGGEGLVERVVDASFGKEDVTIKRLQWSVHATAGVQYNFNKHVGIYIEPKLSHYITTLPLKTQRNEHPFNFNLQLGLSLDF